MEQIHYYEVDLNWNKGRKGKLTSPVLNDSIECATPPEFVNGIEGIWSPEHLFAAAINSCFMATFLAVAENFKIEFSKFQCNTICKLEKVEGKFIITQAVIKPTVKLKEKEKQSDKLMRVLDKSKAACLVTNSIRTEIELIPIIE
ncbi:OsmC family protein [Empedobacter tilapiae]|uniref:OsmC family peroxiredoxin n=1 Tax=Empedobacter tilapiae TaxID=2491114 RepID=A0A4Z1B6B8_9FLAO|nr:OsmC family protein [Empedobacter tilapiae]TGN26616.1 OsmC family peroxiredoxin [Empedobacter tilapiae]